MSTLDSIAALALHPGTPEAEWQAASIAFFRVHRSKGTSPCPSEPQAIPSWHFERPRAARPSWAQPSPFLHKIIPNEKYPGLTVLEVIRLDPDYATGMIAGWAARKNAEATAKKGKQPAGRKVKKEAGR